MKRRQPGTSDAPARRLAPRSRARAPLSDPAAFPATPVSVAANDTDVLSVVQFRARSRATGKTATMHLHHFFKFRDGKIAYYRGTEDTAQTQAVLQN